MKIEVFDRLVNSNDDRHIRFEAERMQLILEGLGSLEQFDTAYAVFGEHTFPQSILAIIAQDGLSALPLTYIDDALYKKGVYLTDDEVMTLTGIHFEITDELVDDAQEHHHDHAGGCSCGHHH